MKTIDIKSLLIGFLLCACGFLTVGATPAELQAEHEKAFKSGKSYSNTSTYTTKQYEVGKFQASSVFVRDGLDPHNGGFVLTTIIDSQTGRVHFRKKSYPSSFN